MAKYRIRWRNILFNLPAVLMLVTQLRTSWPSVREAAKAAVEKDPTVADFIAAADALFRLSAFRR